MSRRSLGRYLGRLAYEIAEQYTRSAETNRDSVKTKGEAPDIPFFVQTVNEEWHREEKQHRKEEKDFWKKSLKYTGLAGFAAAVAAGFSIGAFFQARRQAAAAEEQNRPWLYIERMDASQVTVDGENFSASLDVYISNSGHSVATGVYIAADIVLPENLNFYRTEEYCSKTHSEDFETAGRTAFPGKPMVTIGRPKSLKVIYRGKIPLAVINCIVYKSASDGVERKTGSIFVLKGVDTTSSGIFKDVPATNDYDAGGYAD